MQYGQHYKNTQPGSLESALNTYHNARRSAIKSPYYLSVNYTLVREKKPPQFANTNLSLIRDPLWRRVCSEILQLMGPIAGQIFQVQLGVPNDNSLNLYCQTEETAQFLKTYNFVVLAALQRYFPSLQRLNVTQRLSK